MDHPTDFALTLPPIGRHPGSVALYWIGMVALLAGIAAAPAFAQSAPGAPLIYPAKGQSAQQQDKDRYECHGWARGQSGFDPTQPATAPATASTTAPTTTAAAKTGSSTAGSMAAGAMGGAAIAELTKGNAGQGAAAGAIGGAVLQRVKQQKAQGQQAQQQQQAVQQQQAAQARAVQQQRATYDRALAACMEGRGYTVK